MKNTKYRFILIITSGLFFTATSLFVDNPLNAEQNQKEEKQQPKSRKSTWERILSLFQKEKRALGSRGVCLLSPGVLTDTDEIWHNQPSFIWQSQSKSLEIRLYNVGKPNQPLWRKEITHDSSDSGFKEIIYTGEVLQPNQRYDWEIFDSSEQNKYRQSFKIMDANESNSIAQDLERIETRLAKNDISTEQIILEKAEYFANKGLLSDALTQISFIQNPSPRFQEEKAYLLNKLCIANN